MVMVIKVENWMKIAVGCMIGVLLVTSALWWDAASFRAFGCTTVAAEGVNFHVVVDAGHGGRDGGAVSPNGAREADINLAIARYLRTELELRGIGVTMTRNSPDNLANPLARHRQRSDILARHAIIRNAQPDVVISIHLNTYPKASVRGLQTFYMRGCEQSRAFADAIQTEFNNTHLDMFRRPMTGDYLILESGFPSVLVECGFLSNPIEERLLRTSEYQRILAWHIAEALDTTS